MALDQIQKDRLKKLNNIKRLGIDPYPAKSHRKDLIEKARKGEKKNVVVAGRIRSLRPHGKIAFADLEDASGKIQLFFSLADLPGKYEFLTNLDLGDFIEVSGEIFTTNAGEITVKVKDYTLLTKSIRPLPSAWYGLEDIEERYRQRYVDLIINPEVKKVFDTRHKVISLIRKFMEEKGFVEVETPTLQPIYGGATAKPFVTHHNALDAKLYLRIADELYLKRLIVGGYEKVFEICKDFRNEGIDKQHNPEFTMIEFYWAYADYHDLMVFTEEFVSTIVKQIHGSYKFEYEGVELDFKPPFKVVTFTELLKEHSGIDLDVAKTEEELLKAIKEKGIKLDLAGVVGYGPLIDELYKKVARPKVLQPTLVIEYPADMKPLAKRKAEDPTKSESVQLVAMGFELTNSYSELNDPIEQRKRWTDQLKLAKRGLHEHQVLDEDYIRALEYGMPPTAGWAIGIDRFVALLTNQHTLKDVILFPTLKPEKKGKKK
jgi:lysyl-tRNA synthetase, class II